MGKEDTYDMSSEESFYGSLSPDELINPRMPWVLAKIDYSPVEWEKRRIAEMRRRHQRGEEQLWFHSHLMTKTDDANKENKGSVLRKVSKGAQGEVKMATEDAVRDFVKKRLIELIERFIKVTGGLALLLLVNSGTMSVDQFVGEFMEWVQNDHKDLDEDRVYKDGILTPEPNQTPTTIQTSTPTSLPTAVPLSTLEALADYLTETWMLTPGEDVQESLEEFNRVEIGVELAEYLNRADWDSSVSDYLYWQNLKALNIIGPAGSGSSLSVGNGTNGWELFPQNPDVGDGSNLVVVPVPVEKISEWAPGTLSGFEVTTGLWNWNGESSYYGMNAIVQNEQGGYDVVWLVINLTGGTENLFGEIQVWVTESIDGSDAYALETTIHNRPSTEGNPGTIFEEPTSSLLLREYIDGFDDARLSMVRDSEGNTQLYLSSTIITTLGFKFEDIRQFSFFADELTPVYFPSVLAQVSD
jgi:hypothetical protein